MTEPKTLKDFGEVLSTPQEPFKEWGTWNYIKRKLKQEAIKRAKHHISLLASAKFSKISYGSPFFEGHQTEEDMHHIGRVAEIVEFYNLTNEDLK